ncbi:uncharacterized protein LOC132708634 isoform X2 [Cylas formicarius]|uniref:uncharacterized protein LOC132708634 isoform X2 n=1 Tax=Cylas formicarius TaxID=197179 RepID=UPI0029587C41|nr:uncharacterized protein LOC132708634 isoform X2 [Cylas formicarius]
MRSFFVLVFACQQIASVYTEHANPLENPFICGVPACLSGDSKFKYGPGKYQTYKYSIESRSVFNGTSKNESTLYIEAEASLNFLTPCDGVLTLSEVKLSENIPRDKNEIPEHSNSRLFADMISEQSLRFAFKDGIITELCPEKDEKSWPLNFKRGILSMLHNSMKRFDLDHTTNEEDVRGICPTTYTVIGPKETSLLIEKTKDLSSCIDRAKFNSIVQFSAIPNFQSRTKSQDLLKSKSKCTLSIDHHIYNEIICEETHVLEPFSNQAAGASTVIIQRLSLVEEGDNKRSDEQSEIMRRTSLKFDHAIPKQPTSGNIKGTRDLMKKLCKESHNELHIEFSELFGRFVYELRSLSYPAFSTLYSHSRQTCSTATKHLLDALPYINTGASVALMKDIILKGGVSENTMKEWMLSIAFIPRPDEEMMDSALMLVKEKTFSANTVLSVASLVHTFCSQNSNCRNIEAVASVVEHFEDYLLSWIRANETNRDAEHRIIVTLKALSSIGLISEDFESELFELVEDRDLDIAVRLAAVETFRRSPCERTRSYFDRIYRDQQENSEIRIAAYLQMMRCPNYLLVRTIARNLRHEEVNQVGSFVWSHLQNIVKTANPVKVEIQSLLSEEDLVHKFSSDIRKFSHNREGSMYFEEYNFGGNYENNVIFSPSSYIPRSAMLNLTVDLFGESVNLLEVYGRVEGFERYLESLFGPNGRSSVIKEKMENLKMRWTRGAKENELIESKVHALPDVTGKTKEEPKVSFGMRVFGNDLKYATLRGDDEIRAAVESFNVLNYLKQILSGKEINYKHSGMFLDINYVVPSCTGLPLSLSGLGTASVDVKLFGSLKAAGFSSRKELDLVANMESAASMEISAEMSLNAFYAGTGIKLKTNLYTSSAVRADVKLRGAKLVSIKFGMPKKNAKLFGARSELLVRKTNVEQKQRGLSDSKTSNSICSWSGFSDVFGLKLCTDYSFVNVSRVLDAPYFLLAGPAEFQLYINKSDPTADVYLFEYKWSQAKDVNMLSLTFDTPGSTVKRLIHANFTIDRQTQNLTMLIQSSAGEMLARGIFKNSDEEKFLQVVLDINNKKHFDASISYERLVRTNGYIYKPKVYLGVNGERVMELQGSIDYISKKDISQYTVDLKFHTKRLTSKLFGYISKTESSIGADLHLDYRFQHTRQHRVSLKFSLANRSRKNIAIIIGTCDVRSSAYPNVNFNTNVTFQRSGSHMEFKIGLIQNPLPLNDPNSELESLKFDFIFSHKSFADSKQTIRAAADIKRKSSNLDLKGMILYESINADVNVECVINYGNNKQISATVFWSHPRATLEEIRAHVNLTLPTFSPMLLSIEISEKMSRDYKLNLSGTWFSGHSAHAVGYYKDKTNAAASNYHLKLFITSPNFEDVDADLQYYRDNGILKVDFKAIHDNNDYQVFLNHNTTATDETATNAKLKYKTKLYTLDTLVNTGEHIKVTAELHIDQLRDIDFSLWIFNEETQKALGFDINWDANRDPNQKLLVGTNFTKSDHLNYNADFIVSYPGRTILGKYEFLLQKGQIDMLASVSWDDSKSFAISLNSVYKYEEEIYLEISCKLNTPLDQWRNTRLNAVFEHSKNKYNFNGVLFWDVRQQVAIDLFGDYFTRGNKLDYKYACSVSSTLDRIPDLNTTIKHSQNGTYFNTSVYLKYTPEFLIDLDSAWVLNENENYSNLTGTVTTQTPFKGFHRGVLVSKIYFTSDKYLRGVADLDVDHQKLIVNMEGKFKRLMDSMFVANVTSQDEMYQAKFKLSKAEKHFVALLTYPTGNMGSEILLQITNLTTFDAKLFLATPLEFLENLIIVGKLQQGQADFRIGWNSLLLGFSGVWHYANIIDFEYSYKIYTPIKDFEENGVVGKLVLKVGLDFEVSLKLSLYKLGVKLVGQPKRKPLKELGINVTRAYSAKTVTKNRNEDADFLSWEGLIELDVIIYPTVKGKLEIDQNGPSYVLQSKINLPHGTATIFDEFVYIDVLTMSNHLEISTPYSVFKTASSLFRLSIINQRQYSFRIGFNYQNESNRIDTELFAEYNVDRRDIDENTHNVTLEVKTPFRVFPKLNLFGAYETEENFYRTRLLFNTNKSDVSLDATTEIDEDWLGLTADFYAKTPIISLPQCQLRFTKLMSYSDNYVEVRFKVPERFKSEVYFRTSWLIKSLKQFRTILQLESPFAGLENTTVGVNVLSSSIKTTLWAFVQVKPLEIEVNSTLEDNVLHCVSLLQFNEKRIPINVRCKITSPSSDRRKFDGTLSLTDKVYKINGNSSIIGGLPVKVLITFTPEDNGRALSFQYYLKTTLNDYELNGDIHYSDSLTRFTAHATANDKYNWEFNLQVEPPNATQKLAVHAVAATVGNGVRLDIAGKTNIPKLENPKCGLNFSTGVSSLKAFGYFQVPLANGSADIEIIYVVLEDMFLKAVGRFENSEYGSQSSVLGYYKNPKKTFQYLDAGGDIKFDRLWGTSANVSFYLPQKNNVSLEAHLQIPNDFEETHSLFGKLNYGSGLKFIDYLVKYRSTYPVRKYGTWAKICLGDKRNVSGNAVIEWDGKEFENDANLMKQNKSMELIYKLKTPKFADKHLVVTKLRYDLKGDHHNITFKTFYPEGRSVAYGTIDYVEIANMHGTFNVTIPYKALNFTGVHFKTDTDDYVYNRYVKVFWDNDNALLDSKCDIKTGNLITERNYKGRLIVELPLTTRHFGNINYEYDKKAELSTGEATVDYNGENVLEGKYNCLSKSRAGLHSDTIHVELLNKMVPIGADYVRRHENVTLRDGNSAPTVEKRHVHLYHLKNQSKFNVTGELDITTFPTGQEFILSATHLNRTVTLWTDYAVQSRKYSQHSRIELSPSVWVEYDLSLVNKTMDDVFDAQMVFINISYPRRNFTAEGFYNLSDSIVSTDVSLVWDKDNKTVRATLDWRRISPHREQLELLLKHPSFERDVSFVSGYGYSNSSLDGELVIEYSTDPYRRVSLGVRADDKSERQTYNYTYNIWAEHNATNLYLNCFGHVYWSPTKCGTVHIADYKRSYLPLSEAETLAVLDFDLNDVKLKKNNTLTGLSYFWGRYSGDFPVYSANMTTIDGTNHTSGKFHLHFTEKLLYLDVNMTEDGSQSLHTYGIIPDARSARFDIWRDYEDKRLTDVSYYLKLNHSRLIMSSLRWRPELISDVQNGIRSKAMQLYYETLEEINNTRQYIKAESLDALDGIWQDAKPIVRHYLDDLRNLTVIEEDVQYLKAFMNKSYQANEFYVKDICTVVLTLFDELSLKSHLQSLPKILQELWQVMGQSGQNIRKSINFVIDKIKLYYAHATQFVHDLINGDPVKHISKILEKLVDRYDAFIKNVHVSALQYMERLWSETYGLIVKNWHEILAALEPTFIKFAHYIETIVWSTGKEFLDFLYIRKNKIIESAYFMEFTKFSKDVDRFYKDITGNNTVEAIYKYSSIAWNFLNEKYINHIPFGKELEAVVMEIWAELKQLGDIPSIKYLTEKYHNTADIVKYYYKYFQVEYRVHKLIRFIYRKLSEMTIKALEFENRQREAKTKFVYDPNEGVMLMEQKLPMSWHAFNETPKFQRHRRRRFGAFITTISRTPTRQNGCLLSKATRC